MSDLMPFSFHGHDVPAIRDDHGEPWWKATDVCQHCEIKNVSKACERLDADEKAVITSSDTAGRPQDMLVVNEAGLYTLVLSSRKAQAKVFKRWITHEVLPQIRKTGRYDATPPQVKNPIHQLMIDTVIRLDVVEQRALEAEQHAIAAEQRAVVAETKADLALADAHQMTLEEFILKNGLVRQFPLSKANIATYTAWLKDFCLRYGRTVHKVPVVGKPWPDENAYPLVALGAWLRYEQTKPQQVHLVQSPPSA